MTEKQINKWLRRRFTVIGWVLIGYYGLINLLVMVTMSLDMAKQTLWNLAVGDFFGNYDMDALMANGWGYITACIVLMLILAAWQGREFWQQEVFAKSRKMTVPVFLAMISLCMGSQLVSNLWLWLLEVCMNLMGRSMLDVLETVSGSTDSFSMFLYASILAPVTEELVFRGYVLRSLRPYGKRFAILFSALLFGLFHGNLMQAPYAFLVGLLLGYLALEYSVVWACVLHVFNNLVLAEGLGRLTAGMSEMMAGVVHISLFALFAAVSVGILISKRHQIADFRQSEWVDRRCVKCLLTSGGIIALLLMMAGNMLTMLFI